MRMAEGTKENCVVSVRQNGTWNICVRIVMTTKCQGMKVLCSWDGYEVVRNPMDHYKLGIGAAML